VQVTEEAVRAGHGGGGPCRSRRRRSIQVTEEAVRAGDGGELIQKFRISQVFLFFPLMRKSYIDIKHKLPVKF
jgi:hypothetical protein